MNYGIILCGGSGLRMGKEFQVPKQYIKVNNRYVFSYCLEVIDNNPLIDKIIICAHENWREIITETISEIGLKKEFLFSDPGETRQMSVYNSLKVAKLISFEISDLAVIHDGARPLIDDDILNDCILESNKHDGAIATIKVNDTIYQSDNGTFITNIPKRDSLRAGQTPEAFNLKKYFDIHQSCSNEVINSVTGGAEFAANNGMKISFSKGNPGNIKITTKKDLELFKDLIK
jgi:2-C-methyl-D-erythritol 4-phosphate cytidylyltransferase|tara:strand:- start:230 stop:925 length:696 start_codon:yes stop_codon:yes gene_type:complete